MTDAQKSAALQVIASKLADEKPVILHDAHDSGDYILLLKGLSEVSQNVDTENAMAMAMLQDGIGRYLKSIATLLPFLHQSGLLDADFDFHALYVDDTSLTGLTIPGGKPAIDALEQLFRDHAIPNPFTYVESAADRGMIDVVLAEQFPTEQKGRSA